MKRACAIILLSLLVIGLLGCRDSSAAFKEVKLQELSREAKVFVNQTGNGNGIFLFAPVDGKQYLIVRYVGVSEGEEAKYLTALHASVRDRTLILNLEEQATADYADERLNRGTRVFDLGRGSNYDRIEVYRNGTASPIDAVGG